jgi:hypothetical protein
MSMGSLIARGHGQHRSMVFINASTLAQAKYVLKTKLDISETFYQHSEFFPIYGSGQGAGNSPGLWGCISSVLFKCYEEKAHGAYFESPDGSIKVKVFMIGFVDDTSGSSNDFLHPNQQPLEHYVARATHDAQRWNDLLNLTGGALNDLKCSYHFITYEFTISGLPIPKSGTFDPKICINFNNNPTKTPLKQLSAMATHKTLGVPKAPAGQEDAATSSLDSKNRTHARTVATSPFDRKDTWSYYHAIYLPSITYTFPSSSLPIKQCDKMQRQIKKAVLPKYGFNRNTPNAVVYGHSDYAGIEMRTLSVERGIAQLYSLITCLRADGIPHQLAVIAISWAQLLAGTSWSIFEDTTTPLPHLHPMKWLPSIRDFLGSIQSRLELEETFIPKLQREGDCFLMDHATADKFTPTEIALINACRLFKGVTLLSDSVTADGQDIRTDILLPGKPLNSHKGLMPYQDNPSPKAWSHWKRFLHKFTLGHTTCLQQDLGRWFASGTDLHHQWNSYYCHTHDIVYMTKDSDYEVYIRDLQDFTFSGTVVSKLPRPAIPADLTLDTAQILLLPTTLPFPKLRHYVPTSFSAYVDTLLPWEQALLQDVQFADNVYSFTQYLSPNDPNSVINIHATSDGSAPNFIGTFGWASKASNGQPLATNNGPAQGYRTSSYRAEGYGLLSFLLLVYHACQYTASALPTNLVLHSDCESLILKTNDMMKWPFYYTNAPMDADWDVLQAIITLLRRFSTTPQVLHVTGHQDRKTPYLQLSLPAQLNVDADQLAGIYVYRPQQDPTTTPLITGNKVQLHTPEGTIASNYRSAIRKIASYPAMRKHITHSNRWTAQIFDTIDWPAHGISIRKQYHRKHFITKYVHDWLPLGKLISKYKPHYPSKCPSCPHAEEDRHHFLKCPARNTWHNNMVQELKELFLKHPTRPELSAILLYSLATWLSDQQVIIPVMSSTYASLISNQYRAGWEQLLFGRFVLEWAELQEEYLSSLPSRSKYHSGKIWVTTVNQIIWKHVYAAWESRNDDQHGVDAASREIALATMARKQTAALYDIRDDVLPRDHSLFYSSIEEHHRREPTARGLQQWLSTWQPVLLLSVKTATLLGTRGMASLRTYFPPQGATVPPDEIPPPDD